MEEREYIILHERQHIRRGDHVWKVLCCRDKVMSCDEALLKGLSPEIRSGYGQSGWPWEENHQRSAAGCRQGRQAHSSVFQPAANSFSGSFQICRIREASASSSIIRSIPWIAVSLMSS